MQLVNLSQSLRPITIAVGMITASSFLYSDMDSFSGVITATTNSFTSDYIKHTDERENEVLLQKFRFESHLINWKHKTKFLSSAKAITEDIDFLSIVAMGNSAVPYIIEEIEETPSTIVWALNLIFNKKITSNPNTTISEACKLWVKALRK